MFGQWFAPPPPLENVQTEACNVSHVTIFSSPRQSVETRHEGLLSTGLPRQFPVLSWTFLRKGSVGGGLGVGVVGVPKSK